MRYAVFAGAGLAGVAAAWLAIAGQEQADAPADTIEIMGRVTGPEMLALGEAVYAGNCATCHGAELEGQPDWKHRLPNGRMPAPPHDETGHTWHHSDADLFRLAKEGVAAVIGGDYESNMPAFGDVLTDEEILAVLAFVKSTWPEHQRAYQAEITRKDSSGALLPFLRNAALRRRSSLAASFRTDAQRCAMPARRIARQARRERHWLALCSSRCPNMLQTETLLVRVSRALVNPGRPERAGKVAVAGERQRLPSTDADPIHDSGRQFVGSSSTWHRPAASL